MKNKKILKITGLLFCFSLLLSACGNKTESTPVNTVNGNDIVIEKTEKSVEIEEETEVEEAIVDGSAIDDFFTVKEVLTDRIVEYQKDEEVLVDLNNDGTEEKVLYTIETVSTETEYGTYDENFYHLYINDVDYSEEFEFYEPIDRFFIVDADDTDNYKDILISTYGMSDDLESLWLRYDGESLTLIGDSQMIPNEGITILDNNLIEIYNRTDILETCFVPVNYSIINGELVNISTEGELFCWNTYRQGLLSLKDDLIVHVDRDVDSETFTIPAKAEVDSNTTDMVEWVNIIYDQTEYWLHIKDMQVIDNGEVYTWDMFDNLFLAD